MRKELSFWLLVITFLAGAMAPGYLAHADTIDCDKAVKNQTGTPTNGHYEVCIEVPNRRLNASNRAVVTSEVCEEGYGCHPIDQDGNIDRSKWWANNLVSGVCA